MARIRNIRLYCRGEALHGAFVHVIILLQLRCVTAHRDDFLFRFGQAPLRDRQSFFLIDGRLS